jgi:SAM-dependent methyltransferase
VTTCPVCAGVHVHAVSVPSGRTLVRCARCRLLFDQAPAAVEVPRARLSDDEQRLEERVAQRRAPHFARVVGAVSPPGRLLDVGAGVGELLGIARELGWQAVGVDVDPAVVAYARSRGRDVRLGDLTTLALPAASVDLVTLWNVIDFVPDPLRLLRECRRLLAPGGRIFVRTPNVPLQRAGARLTRALSTVGLARLAGDRPSWLGVFNTSNFGARTLRVALERAGFEDVDVRNSPPIGGDPYLGLGRVGERALDLGKRAVFRAVQAVAAASAGRWRLGPSIEAWGRRPA